MHISEESGCPIVINFVLLDFSICEFLGSLPYYSCDIGLPLLLLKLNPLSNRRAEIQLTLHSCVWGYQNSAGFCLRSCNGVQRVCLPLGRDLEGSRFAPRLPSRQHRTGHGPYPTGCVVQ